MQTRLHARPRPQRPGNPLSFQADPPLQSVAAGHRVRFSLRVENLSDRVVEVEVHASEPTDGWHADLKVSRLRLAPRSATVFLLRVTAPAGAQPGARQGFFLTAAPEHGEHRCKVWVEAVVDCA